MAAECPECGELVENPETTDFEIREIVTTVEIHPAIPERLPAADDKKVEYPPEGEDDLSPRFEVGNRTCPHCGAKLITMEENMGDPEYGEWDEEDYLDE